MICYVQMSVKAREVSVVMPGEKVPTFIANPAPVHCPPERMPWPSHQRIPHEHEHEHERGCEPAQAPP